MPLPEEVDEINEFLKNRREKQRMGELPQPDYTPGFVKKVKVAIFGKPAVPKTVLKSSQPSYVSTEAQVAMRKQLQEMVDKQTSKSNVNAAPAATPTLSTSALKPPAPRNFSNVPYPPYIQRGLASLPKTTPPPSSIPTPRNAAPPLPKMNAPAAPVPTLTTNRPAPFAAAPRADASAPAPLPANWPRSTTPTSPASTTPLSSRTPSATLPGMRASATSLPTRTVNNTPTSTPTAFPRKESFWKKIFGAKPAPLPAAASPVASTPPARPRMDYAYSPIQGVHDQSTPGTRATSAKADILPVNKPTAPAVSPITTPTKTALPVATTPSVPMIRPAPKIETRSPSSPSAAAASTVTPTRMASLSKSPPPSVSPGDGKTKPYLPPWAAPTTTGVSSSAYASSSLPWEEKKNPAPAAVSPIPRPRPAPASSSQEIKVEESERPVALPPSHVSHDAAVREEISEEEALESLPFEEVEGLSQHDLDYLAKKEKEHREVEKSKDLDVGVPSQLKDTLQRQTSQLENVLQSTGTGAPDEKQEILRRLKKMMEDEGHSTG